MEIDSQILKILEDSGITELSDIILCLELYKFYDRDTVINILHQYGIDVKSRIKNTNSDSKELCEIESRFNVVIEKHDDSVEVFYQCFADINRVKIELQLGFVSVVFTPLTPFNYLELCGQIPKYESEILLKRFLLEALKVKATDIHFTVEHDNCKPSFPVYFRKDGFYIKSNLFELTAIQNREIIEKLIESKTLANSLDLTDQAGVVANSSSVLDDGTELRISASTVKGGYHYVIRLQKKETTSLCINELGFNNDVQEALNYLANKRSGITFITGAIRTGKNTTAFAMANEMIKHPIKIISYDSPVEVLMKFPQLDYLGDKDILINAIRLAKKQDINVAFINEIPDSEVAFAVRDLVNSSIYVITTMHVDRIWHLPYKLKEYYGDSYKDVISQINGIMNQKMFGVSCPYCTQESLVESIEDKRKVRILKENGISKFKFSIGCEHCNDDTVGFITGKNQPYVEYIVFDEELKSQLLRCEHPYQMEDILKRKVKENKANLEVSMSKAIEEGKLTLNALDYL